MKFKVGDRIKVVQHGPFNHLISVGDIGTITDIRDNMYFIDFIKEQQILYVDTYGIIVLLEKREIKQFGIVKFCKEHYK